MRHLISGIGILAALILIAASGFMNFTFWQTQGQTAREADLLGSVSVAFDIFKSLLPTYIAWAWALRKRTYMAVGSLLFVLFFSFSLLSAVGFAAGNRGVVSGGREALGLRLAAATAELERVGAQLKGLGSPRAAAVIGSELKALQGDRFWKGSQSCEAPSGGEAQSFCKRFLAKQTELVTSVEADRLRQRVEQLTREIQTLKGQGAGEGKDPQARILSMVSGLGVDLAQKVLVIFIAVLVELGAAFGLFLATGHSFVHRTPVTPVLAPLPKREPAVESFPAIPQQEIEPEPESDRAAPPPFVPLRLERSKTGELVVEEGQG